MGPALFVGMASLPACLCGTATLHTPCPPLPCCWVHVLLLSCLLTGIVTMFCWPCFDTDVTDFSKKFPGMSAHREATQGNSGALSQGPTPSLAPRPMPDRAAGPTWWHCCSSHMRGRHMTCTKAAGSG